MGKADTEVITTTSNFAFSGQRPAVLANISSEFTLVGIAVDRSGSTSPFKADLEKAYREVIGSCRKNPRADNLLVRGVEFDDYLNEIHGFVTLDNIDEKNVKFNPGGLTALYDTTLEGIEAVDAYGKNLAGMDYLVNAVVFVITDGMENASRIANPSKIKKTLETIRVSEQLESIKVILIGIGNDDAWLNQFHKDAGLDQFVSIANADAKSLAKMADFVSRSISSSSQSLGTGGPSANLTI